MTGNTWVDVAGAHLRLSPDGILSVRWKPVEELDLTLTARTIESGYHLTQARPHWVLVDMREVRSLTPEAQGYMATGPHRRAMQGLAIVLPLEVLLTQWGGGGGPPQEGIPMRTVGSEEEGMGFLRHLIAESAVAPDRRASEHRVAEFTLCVDVQGMLRLARAGSSDWRSLDRPRPFRMPVRDHVSEDLHLLLGAAINSTRRSAPLRRVPLIAEARRRAVNMALRSASDGALELAGEPLTPTLSRPVALSLRTLEALDLLKEKTLAERTPWLDYP